MKSQILTEPAWYLREDAYFEPLVNHWYAWPHLLPPATAARHLTHTHRRIMRSFAANHELHAMAIKEKGMAGGEFLNCSPQVLPQIRALLHEMTVTCAGLIELSEAITALDELLRAHTSGKTLEPLYARVPEPLRGFVELHLDLEHRASYRLIEALLYQSAYYMPSLQSLSFGLLSRVGTRPFVLSTPRLPDEDHLRVHVDFNHSLVDRLFRARQDGITTAQRNTLFADISTGGGLDPAALFTNEIPKARRKPVEHGVRLTYTGHAGFLLESDSVAIMIDPLVACRGVLYADEVISYSELPPSLDYICLTHNHQDHFNLETLLQLRHKTKQLLVPKNNGGSLADPSMRLLLQRLGFVVREFDDLDEISLPSGRIVAIPFFGEHGDLNVRSKCAWYIELMGRTFFFGADSSNPDVRLYERMRGLVHCVDVLAIGMECVGAPYTWLYGALHTTPVSREVRKSRRLNGSDARQAFELVQAFGARRVLIYALGLEPWYKYLLGIEYDATSRQILESTQMIESCRRIGVPAECMYGKGSLDFTPAHQPPLSASTARRPDAAPDTP